MDASRPALTALVFGTAIAVAVFVPFVAVQYRRHGELGVRATLVAFAALVYLLAIIAYTLLPLPQETTSLCAAGGAGIQLNPLQFVSDIARVNHGGALGMLRNPAVWQVLLNIALFLPLGIFVRVLGRRGIAITSVVGLAVSALIETTQLTGDWFLYPCAYRLFDVDDLLANTLGAVIGALAAPAFRGMLGIRTTDPLVARAVTALRRLLGAVCDLLFLIIGGGSLSAAVVLIGDAATHRTDVTVGPAARLLLLYAIPAVVQLVVVLTSRRTIGERVVRLRPVPPATKRSALLRWLVGIGGFSLLSMLADSTGALLPGTLFLVTTLMVFTTRGHRGLAYVAAGWDIADDRASV